MLKPAKPLLTGFYKFYLLLKLTTVQRTFLIHFCMFTIFEMLQFTNSYAYQ